MPLIIITGFPCSGKSYRTKQLENYFTNVKKIETIIITDSVDSDKNELYADSQKEKMARSELKSAIQRYIDKEKLVICDSLNYIKGYRYEIFCIVKSAQTTKALVHCCISEKQAHILNDRRDSIERYKPEILDALIQRYEAPDPRNKWDSPLFNAEFQLKDTDSNLDAEFLLADLNPSHPLVDLPFEEIYNVLFNCKPLAPNLSTLPQVLSSSNYLHQLDTATQIVIKDYIEAMRHSLPGETVALFSTTLFSANSILSTTPFSANLRPTDHHSDTLTVHLPGTVPTFELQKLRRQFVSYTRQHPPASERGDVTRLLFLQFLKERLA